MIWMEGYLSAPAFRCANHGPRVDGLQPRAGRDPSPKQIRDRCEAIRATWNRRDEYLRRVLLHGEGRTEITAPPRWTPPIVALVNLVKALECGPNGNIELMTRDDSG